MTNILNRQSGPATLTTVVEEWGKHLKTIMDPGAAQFKTGPAKRFAAWGDSQGWNEDDIPEDAVEMWRAASIAIPGKKKQAVTMECNAIEQFLSYLENGDEGGLETGPELVDVTGTEAGPVEVPVQVEVPAPAAIAVEVRTPEPEPVQVAVAAPEPEPIPAPAPVPAPVAAPVVHRRVAGAPPPPPQSAATVAAAAAVPKPVKVAVPPAQPRDAFAGVLPQAGRVHVWKRGQGGKLGPVGEYTPEDVSGEGPIAFFLKKYVEPDFGPGDYEVRRVGRDGNDVLPGWQINIPARIGHQAQGPAPVPGQPTGSPVSQLKEMLDLAEYFKKTLGHVPEELQSRLVAVQGQTPGGIPGILAGADPNEAIRMLAQLEMADTVTDALKARAASRGGQSPQQTQASGEVADLKREVNDLKDQIKQLVTSLNQPQAGPDLGSLIDSVAAAVKPPAAAPQVDLLTIAERLGTLLKPTAPQPVTQPDTLDQLMKFKTLFPDPMQILASRLEAMEKNMVAQPSRGIGDLVKDTQAVLQLGQLINGGATGGIVGLVRDVIVNAPAVADAATRVILAAKGLAAMHQAAGTMTQQLPAQTGQSTKVPQEAEQALRALVGEKDPIKTTELVFTAVRAFAMDPHWMQKLAPALTALQQGDPASMKVFVKNLLTTTGMGDIATEELLDRVSKSLTEIMPQIVARVAG